MLINKGINGNSFSFPYLNPLILSYQQSGDNNGVSRTSSIVSPLNSKEFEYVLNSEFKDRIFSESLTSKQNGLVCK